MAPKYDLSDEEYAEGQTALADLVREQYGEAVCAVWESTYSSYANLVRTAEAKIFPEIPEIMQPYENESAFLAIVDTRQGKDGIVHAFRISTPELSSQERIEQSESEIRIALIQDLIDSDQNLSAEEFKSYYKSKNIDIDKCLSVETNFKIGGKTEGYNGLPISQLGYIAIFQFIAKQGISDRDRAIFAHLNKPAIVSLGLIGLEYGAIAGRSDLKTPTVGDKKFDPHYSPVEIPPSEKNLRIFGELTALAAPTLYV